MEVQVRFGNDVGVKGVVVLFDEDLTDFLPRNAIAAAALFVFALNHKDFDADGIEVEVAQDQRFGALHVEGKEGNGLVVGENVDKGVGEGPAGNPHSVGILAGGTTQTSHGRSDGGKLHRGFLALLF